MRTFAFPEPYFMVFSAYKSISPGNHNNDNLFIGISRQIHTHTHTRAHDSARIEFNNRMHGERPRAVNCSCYPQVPTYIYIYTYPIHVMPMHVPQLSTYIYLI